MKYIFLMILAVLVAGCVSQTGAPVSNVPSISIISPVDGQNIQGTSTIKIDLSSNIKLVPAGGEVKEGEGHFHVYLDGSNEQRGVKTSFEYTGVTLGVHTIRAELHKSDHSLYEGAVKSMTVNLGSSPATIAAKQFDVVARQWSFEPGTIEVSQGDVVILKIKSVDVEHGFALPDFGVSQKLEPGKETVVQFTADKKGTFTFFCNVLCGSGHKDMKGTLVVK
ncbi:MAG: cupredoxin domain-containing protein [Candidatus Aenigmarchaeota archaeon]|nr:cupredoxin domain-containing protein [Candidatus Aenigmarchaeota archaeon]MDI6722708.1 cupredoxin domain-containing protein [Candidatus Aenigmarchaeota archaeon]